MTGQDDNENAKGLKKHGPLALSVSENLNGQTIPKELKTRKNLDHDAEPIGRSCEGPEWQERQQWTNVRK